jgi:ABC-type nitrate/sulfonate/bicarbonate transport system permease component
MGAVAPQVIATQKEGGRTLRQRKQSRQALRLKAISLLGVVLFLILWQVTSWFKWVNPLFISSPSRVAVKAAEMLASSELYQHLGITGLEFLVGFGLACAVAVPFGLMYGWNRTFRAFFDPFVSGLYSTPMIALLPLLIIAFGIGIKSKIAMIFLSAFFPIAINTASGMQVLDASLVKAARAFGASNWQLFTTVGMPSCVPFILAGLRLAVGRALIGVVVGEMYAGTSGIGYLLAVSGQTFETDTFFVAVIIVVLAGYSLTEGLKWVEGRFATWRPQSN